VDLLRASAIAILTAAGASILSGSLTAEDLNAALVIEPDRPGGYMKLGGGLAKAIVKRRRINVLKVQRKEPEDTSPTAARPPPRAIRRASISRRATDDGPPIKFISQTLDPSGQNIIGLIYSPPPPVD
jgi:hypothetical protein